VRETDRMSGQVLSDRDYFDGLLKDLPTSIRSWPDRA